jgi:hypothetical protein
MLSLNENGSSLLVVRPVPEDALHSSVAPSMAIRLLLVKAFSRRPPGNLRSGRPRRRPVYSRRGPESQRPPSDRYCVVFAPSGTAGSGWRSGDLPCRGTPRRRSPAAPWPTSHPAPATAPAAADGSRPPRRSEPATPAEPALMSHTPCRFPHHIPAPSAPILQSRLPTATRFRTNSLPFPNARGACFAQRGFRAPDRSAMSK